jgi:hypothetical protein
MSVPQPSSHQPHSLPSWMQVLGWQVPSHWQVEVLQVCPVVAQVSGQVLPHWSLPQQRPLHWGVQPHSVLQALWLSSQPHWQVSKTSSRFPQLSVQYVAPSWQYLPSWGVQSPPLLQPVKIAVNPIIK